jgi:hypothetical protein
MEENKKTPQWLQALFYIGGIVLAGYLLARLFEYLFPLGKGPKPRIFISHSWDYDKEYKTLVKRFDYHGFEFYNHSIPEEKALDENTNRKIEHGIRNKIRGCSKVLVLAGPYANKYWIKREVAIANELGKEIIAIRPWKSAAVPEYLKTKADRIIGFNAKSIIEIIKK